MMDEIKFGSNVFSIAATPAERRELIERERLQRAAARQESLATLSSPQLQPRQRIAMWEHLHGLHLPTDSKHALVTVIARRTALSIDDVHSEQERRSIAAARSASESRP